MTNSKTQAFSITPEVQKNTALLNGPENVHVDQIIVLFYLSITRSCSNRRASYKVKVIHFQVLKMTCNHAEGESHFFI